MPPVFLCALAVSGSLQRVHAQEVSGAGASPAPPPAAASSSPASTAAAAPLSTAPPPASAEPDLEALAERYRTTGTVSPAARPQYTLFPYGHGIPTLRCAPLRVCAVELEPGEVPIDSALGDPERWFLRLAAAGAGGKTPLLLLKPSACDITTNLLVATDRRTYQIQLDSPDCKGADSGEAGFNPKLAYTSYARFWYPDDFLRHLASRQALAEADAASRTPLASGAKLETLHFNYDWHRDGRFPWTPAAVFDDGERTFVLLPPSARAQETPALFLVRDGRLELINYVVRDSAFIVDRVIDRAAFVLGTDPRHPRRLDIVNRSRN